MRARPLYACSASTLAAEIRAGRVTSRAVIEAHLERIAAINPASNAVTVVFAEEALAAADRADRGPPMGPLHGVPFTIKENLDCVGSPTTHGVWALRTALPYVDAPIVARMKAAGAIPIGRANQSEMGLRLCTDNPLRGRTRNPWRAELTIGGSSGGDAAAVATGMTPLGLGNDMGGSLRVPAGCAGVAGLKPTQGRVPHASSLPPHDYGFTGQAMLSHGPLARSVADLELCLSIIAGRDVRDPGSVDAPRAGPPMDAPRAAIVTALPNQPLPSSAVAAIERAGALLEAAGWAVDEAAPPQIERIGELWTRLIATDYLTLLPQMAPMLTPALAAHLDRICRSARLEETSNHRLHTERARLSRAWSGFFAEYPVVVGPNWGRPIWPIDADLDPIGGLDRLHDTVRFTLPANALGLPALALPMGVVDGLPTGVQIYADRWREDLCLEAGAIIEAGVEMPTPIEPR